jgi:hypothetical protein
MIHSACSATHPLPVSLIHSSKHKSRDTLAWLCSERRFVHGTLLPVLTYCHDTLVFRMRRFVARNCTSTDVGLCCPSPLLQHRTGYSSVQRGQDTGYHSQSHKLLRRPSASVSLTVGDRLLSRGAVYQHNTHNPLSVYALSFLCILSMYARNNATAVFFCCIEMFTCP